MYIINLPAPANQEDTKMDYRKMENINTETSLLGFGCMRFPILEGGKINEPESERMLDAAYKGGVTYFDTAYPYHDGASEPFVGRVLNKYDRSSYYLATKLPCWKVNTIEDAHELFESQISRLDKDYFDFYLLHALSKDSWKKMVNLGVIEFCEELKAKGRIRNFGFSFHDDYAVFEEIISYRKWDFCQIQLNYMDVNEQAGMKGYLLAEKLGIPVVVMEPIKGSSIAAFPGDITGIFQKINPDASTASWALRWVGSLPNVKVILSGMSTMEQVEDNLKTFSPFVPLGTDEMAAVDEVVKILNTRVNNGCTGCRYCMPCPSGLDIPYNFKVWNAYGIYGNKGQVRYDWGQDMQDQYKAKHCSECGQCEDACPQKIHIREDLKKLQSELDAVCK